MSSGFAARGRRAAAKLDKNRRPHQSNVYQSQYSYAGRSNTRFYSNPLVLPQCSTRRLQSELRPFYCAPRNQRILEVRLRCWSPEAPARCSQDDRRKKDSRFARRVSEDPHCSCFPPHFFSHAILLNQPLEGARYAL